MTRFKVTKDGKIPLTLGENAECDARELLWSAESGDRKAAEIRAERNAKIAACDWRVLPDVLNSGVWKNYRQALRDIPAQPGFPENIVWPVEP